MTRHNAPNNTGSNPDESNLRNRIDALIETSDSDEEAIIRYIRAMEVHGQTGFRNKLSRAQMKGVINDFAEEFETGEVYERPAQPLKGMDLFEKIIATDSNPSIEGPYQEGFYLSMMLVDLLRNYHASKKDNSVAEKLGINPEHLQSTSRILFGSLRGRALTKPELIALIEKSDAEEEEGEKYGVTKLIFKDILGCSNSSDAGQINERMLSLISTIRQLRDWRKFAALTHATRDVRQTKVAMAISEAIIKIEEENPKNEEELMNILEEARLPIPDAELPPFDGQALQKMLVKLNMSVEINDDPQPAPRRPQPNTQPDNRAGNSAPVNIESLRSRPELAEAIEFLNELESAFKATKEVYEQEFMANFDGKDRHQLRRELNAKFPEAVLGSSFMIIKDRENALSVIAERFNLKNDPDALARKVQEVHTALKGMYPNIFKTNKSADSDVDPATFEDLFND